MVVQYKDLATVDLRRDSVVQYWKTRNDEEDFFLPLFFEMVGPWVFDDEEETLYDSSAVFVDPADFGGTASEAWFTGVCSRIFTLGGTATLSLVHSVAGTVATLVWGYDDYPNTLKRASFIPPAVAGFYKFQVEAGGSADGSWTSVNFVIVRKSPKEFMVHIPLMVGDASSGGFTGSAAQNNFWSYSDRTNSITPVASSQSSGGVFDIFRKDESKYDAIAGWRFDVIGWTWSFGGVPPVAHAALFNRNTGNMVAGSQIDFANNENLPTWKSVNIPNNAAEFTNGHDFEVRIWRTGGTGTAVGLYSKADLWVKVADFKKADLYIPAMNLFGSNANFGLENRVWAPLEWFDGLTLSGNSWVVTSRNPDATTLQIQVLESPEDFGAGAAVAEPSSVTVTAGTWLDPNEIIGGGGLSDASFVSNTANEVGSVRISGFTWNVVPVDPILGVQVQLFGGGDNASPLFGVPYGVTVGVHGPVSQNIPRASLTFNPDPVYILNGAIYAVPGPWTAVELLNPNLDITITHPNNGVLMQFFLRLLKAIYVSFGSPLANDQFPTNVNRVRLVDSGYSLSAVNNRYYPLVSKPTLNTFHGHGFMVISVEK